MNYKEVFQLAKSKGYKTYCMNKQDEPFIEVGEKNFEKENICELTMLQKWLRDTHKTSIDCRTYQEVEIDRFLITIKFLIGNGKRIKCNGAFFSCKTLKSYYKTYEEALLHGINEALHLI